MAKYVIDYFEIPAADASRTSTFLTRAFGFGALAYGDAYIEVRDAGVLGGINADKGDLEIYRFREIVDDDSEDIWDFDKVSLSEAKKIEPDFEIGEEVSEQVFIEDFGRRAVTTARQTLIQKVKDLEKDILFQKYKDLL